MDYDDEKKSLFNAGVAQTERIDSLQRAINAARFNPLQINPETMTYNYEVLINANDGLSSEAWAKLNEKEQKKTVMMQRIVKDYAKNFPPIFRNSNGETCINKDNYEKLMLLLNLYERMNKEHLDAHNLNAPNKDDEGDDWDY